MNCCRGRPYKPVDANRGPRFGVSFSLLGQCPVCSNRSASIHSRNYRAVSSETWTIAASTVSEEVPGEGRP
jgi:hypothetical protein